MSDPPPPLTPEDHFDVLLARLPTEETTATNDDAPWVQRVDGLLAALDRAANAGDQASYERASGEVFEVLDALEARLDDRRYLLGSERPSRADWWLYCVLVRFDAVYYGLYKCNRRRIVDYDNLGGYLRDLHQRGELDDTVDFAAIRTHYYRSDELLNPRNVVPLGRPDLWLPHDRAARFDADALRSAGVEEDQQRRRDKGEWVRKQSAHRNWIQEGEPGRYHVYIANNCPWCHRVTLTRSILGLQDAITMDVLFYRRDPERGWQFKPDEDGCTADTIYGHRFIRELYDKMGSEESSVPILFDKKTETIVNNESAEIIRMLNSAFRGTVVADDAIDLYPVALRAEIDQLNAWIYTDVNNGAYKAGFSRSQDAYEKAYERFFAALERLDGILADRRFLTGAQLTEADVRLFPTIFRFDHIYFTRFLLDKKTVRDHRHLHRWLRDVYHQPGVAEASSLDHARKGYFGRTGNNFIPVGPDLDFEPPPTEAELARL